MIYRNILVWSAAHKIDSYIIGNKIIQCRQQQDENIQVHEFDNRRIWTIILRASNLILLLYSRHKVDRYIDFNIQFFGDLIAMFNKYMFWLWYYEIPMII